MATTLDRSVTQWRVLASCGYADIPRPFEGHWGYSIAGLGGVGSIPIELSPQFSLLTGPTGAVFYRLTASNEVWNEDKSPTKELFVFLGARALGEVATGGDDHGIRIESAGLLGLMLTTYTTGAP